MLMAAIAERPSEHPLAILGAIGRAAAPSSRAAIDQLAGGKQAFSRAY
jgi:hypothetical protein